MCNRVQIRICPLQALNTSRAFIGHAFFPPFQRSHLFSLFKAGFLSSKIVSQAAVAAISFSPQGRYLRFQTSRMPQIQYSERYNDDVYEYRHVVLPPDVAKLLPKDRLLSEAEWRSIGVQQSRGWIHYAIHKPEPHIMLFKRPLNPQQTVQQQQPIQANGVKA